MKEHMKSNGQFHIAVYLINNLLDHVFFFFKFYKSRYNNIFVNVIYRDKVALEIIVNGYQGRVLRKRLPSQRCPTPLKSEKSVEVLIFFFPFLQLTKANKSKKIS